MKYVRVDVCFVFYLIYLWSFILQNVICRRPSVCRLSVVCRL